MADSSLKEQLANQSITQLTEDNLDLVNPSTKDKLKTIASVGSVNQQIAQLKARASYLECLLETRNFEIKSVKVETGWVVYAGYTPLNYPLLRPILQNTSLQQLTPENINNQAVLAFAV